MNLVAFVRILGLLILARFLLSFLKHLRDGYRGASKAAASRDHELVRDRVCNTFLPRERAIHALVNGHEEHFCSAACRDQALRLQPAQ